MSCGVGRRLGWGSALLWLWLWHRPEATAQLDPWKPPYAMGAALKDKKIKRQKKEMRINNIKTKKYNNYRYNRSLKDLSVLNNLG